MNEEVRQVADAAKDPAAYHWLTYAWVVLISAWGGLVRFLNEMRARRENLRDSLITLFTGLFTSTFVGVITFYACEVARFEPLTTAICVALTGHMGAEAIRFFRMSILSRLKAVWTAIIAAPRPDDEEPKPQA